MNVYSLIIITIFSFSIGIILLIFSFYKFKKSKIRSLFIFLLSIIFFLLSLSSLFLFQSLRTYKVLTRKDLIAKISAEKVAEDTMIVYIKSPEKHTPEVFKKSPYLIVGDQWEIQGLVVKWKTYMEFLGVHTGWKLLRLKGRYTDMKKESPTFFPLGKEDFITEILMKYGEKILFVDAVYGEGVFQYPGKKPFYLYVSEDGFILKKTD